MLWRSSHYHINESTEADWGLIANSTISRTVTCPPGTLSCKPVVIFLTDVVDKTSYFMQVSLPPQSLNSTLITSSSFRFQFNNAQYSQFELGFRMTFCCLALFVGVVYFCSIRGLNAAAAVAHGASPYIQGTSWLKALIVGLFLFNNPVFFLQFLSPHAAIIFVASLWQITFVVVLLVFWLVEFALLASDDPRASMSSVGFWAPKLLLVVVYWGIAVGFYAWVSFKRQQDPLFNWYVPGDACVCACVCV